MITSSTSDETIFRKGRADYHAHGQIHNIATHGEILEFF